MLGYWFIRIGFQKCNFPLSTFSPPLMIVLSSDHVAPPPIPLASQSLFPANFTIRKNIRNLLPPPANKYRRSPPHSPTPALSLLPSLTCLFHNTTFTNLGSVKPPLNPHTGIHLLRLRLHDQFPRFRRRVRRVRCLESSAQSRTTAFSC